MMSGSISQDEADLKEATRAKIATGLAEHPGFKPRLNVILGRFQPLHNGHIDLIRAGIVDSGRVLLLVGSATESRSLDNPFTYSERKALIEKVFATEVAAGELLILPLRDMKYRDDAWLKNAGSIINRACDKFGDVAPVIFGMAKDAETAACLDIFKGIRGFGHKLIEQERPIDATDIRAELFAGTTIDDDYFGADILPVETKEFLIEFKETRDFHRLVLEDVAIRRQQQINREIVAINGFPPLYVACDGLIVWKDHWGKPHLLIGTRKGEIGRGKYCMVGGYVNAGETILQAMYREAGPGEEANLDLSIFNLKGVKVFDHPKRSKRGHMITHVHHFEYQGDFAPEVEAGDDLETIQWMPADKIAALQDKFFADHYHILVKMMPEIDSFYQA